MFGVICADDLRGIGRACGCGRAFAGLHSERATTTAEVVESPMRLGDVVMAFRDSLTKGGWIDDATGPEDAAELVHSAVMEMLTVADRYEPGTVIGTRLGSQYVRATLPPAAAGRAQAIETSRCSSRGAPRSKTRPPQRTPTTSQHGAERQPDHEAHPTEDHRRPHQREHGEHDLGQRHDTDHDHPAHLGQHGRERGTLPDPERVVPCLLDPYDDERRHHARRTQRREEGTERGAQERRHHGSVPRRERKEHREGRHEGPEHDDRRARTTRPVVRPSSGAATCSHSAVPSLDVSEAIDHPGDHRQERKQQEHALAHAERPHGQRHEWDRRDRHRVARVTPPVGQRPGQHGTTRPGGYAAEPPEPAPAAPVGMCAVGRTSARPSARSHARRAGRARPPARRAAARRRPTLRRQRQPGRPRPRRAASSRAPRRPRRGPRQPVYVPIPTLVAARTQVPGRETARTANPSPHGRGAR